ncbi:MAG: S41 family peptidase [Rhodoferax sp.]|nr:S41 family peptidase [Rhodoferax sp.]
MGKSTSHFCAARRVAAMCGVAVVCVGLGACGGGGGGGSAGSSLVTNATTASADAQSCAPTNPYAADAKAATTVGSLDTEKAWVKAYMERVYLWWSDMPTVDAKATAFSNTNNVPGSLNAYFGALKTPLKTPSGTAVDQFSFIYPTKAWNDLSVSGTDYGYGIEWYRASRTPPRGYRVAMVQPGSPAALAGVQRGDTLVSIDAVSSDTNTSDGVDVLNAALGPSAAGQTHQFIFTAVGGSTRNVSLSSTAVVSTPVAEPKVLQSPLGRKVGYVLFNDHFVSAEAPLRAAIQSMADQKIEDLVLDLRYNGGGYLYIASQLSYMIAGASRTQGKVFEQQQFNSKRPAETAKARLSFRSTACDLDPNFNCTRNDPLPTLNLNRVFVLTSSGTCSASESIVNGLRGVNVEVILVGQTTCGKPYGFTAKDNCGISYFPIEFKGVNAKGEGDYANGFSANCAAKDDLSHALGDVQEGQLAAALYRVDNDACVPPATVARALSLSGGGLRPGELLRGPERTNRFMLPH